MRVHNTKRLPMTHTIFKNHLRTRGKINLVEALLMYGIGSPSSIVSELRKTYGDDCIVTEHEWLKTTEGRRFKCRVYRLSASGREKMFPVKKDFPSWIFQFNSK